MASKRVAFTFDERNFHILYSMTEKGNFKSMAECVRESLQIMRAFQNQCKEGFTEITLRNPTTDAERVLIIPSLERFKGSTKDA